MKVRVSKNLKGTLVISAISTTPMKKDDEHTITPEQYWHPAVQDAIEKKYLIITGGALKKKHIVQVRKTCVGSLSLPIVKKILRDTDPFSIAVELLDHSEFKHLFKTGKLEIFDGKSKTEKSDSNDKPIVWDARKKADDELDAEDGNVEEPKEKHVIKRKHASKKQPKQVKQDKNSILIDMDDGDESDISPLDQGINWVDAEETAKRIAEHPILSKKKGYRG